MLLNLSKIGFLSFLKKSKSFLRSEVIPYTPISSDVYYTASDREKADSFYIDGNDYVFTLRENYQRPSDESGDSSNNVHRSELVSPTYQNFGTLLNLNYEFMIEPGSPITSDFFNCGQWHPSTGGLSPVFAFRCENEQLRIITRSSATGDVVRYTESLRRNHWYKVEGEFVFSKTAGSLKLTLDGVVVINQTNMPFAFDADTTGPNWQFGAYKRVSPEDLRVRFRNISGPGTRTIGNDMLSNGDFQDSSVWTIGSFWSIISGRANKITGGNSTLSQPVSLTSGKTYVSVFDLIDVTSGTVTARLIGGTTVSSPSSGNKGVKINELVANSNNNTFGLNGSTSFVGSIAKTSLYPVN